MNELTPDHPLHDAKLRLDQVPQQGRNIVVDAEPEECVAIAVRMQVEAVSRFAVTLNAMPIKGGIQVRGKLSAQVTQLCVVTFVPVEQTINEEFARIFLHGSGSDKPAAPGAEVFVDLEGEDLPDYFEGSEVDFTGFLMEVLALAIDPYPRAPGAELATSGDPDDDGPVSPFAKLEKLKRQRD